MSVSPSLVQALEATLKEEVRLTVEYADFLRADRARISSFDTAGLEEAEAKRLTLLRGLEAIEAKRLDLVGQFPGAEQGGRLSVFVEAHCNPADRRRLGLVIDTLKKVAAEVQDLSRELNQTSSFALRLIHGSLSIIWSATQNVTRCYTAFGNIKEHYTPTYSRAQNVLKEA